MRFYGDTPKRMSKSGLPVGDIAAMSVHLPRDSATLLAVHPRQEFELWDVNAHLLAMAVDLLAGANWQRTGRSGGRPNPIPRPTIPTDSAEGGFESVADFREWYATQPGGRELSA